MATIKKAQLGNLVRKGVKKATKEIIPVAEKNLTNITPAYNKKGLNMAIERRVNPEAAKKKMTKAQRQSFEVDDSYRKNGGTVKKAQVGSTVSKILSKKSSGLVNDIVKKSAGMTDKPFKFTPVVLTDAQKASNAAILKNPGTATAESWKRARNVAKKESDIDRARNMTTGKTRMETYYENSNKHNITRPGDLKIGTLSKMARDIKRWSANAKKKNGGTVKAKNGMWMQKAATSIKKRGTAGKCTPITKPGCTGKAKTLAKTFKKIAKSNKKK